jgi:hypothetical protein
MLDMVEKRLLAQKQGLQANMTSNLAKQGAGLPGAPGFPGVKQ